MLLIFPFAHKVPIGLSPLSAELSLAILNICPPFPLVIQTFDVILS